jgi:hypothetical protein
MLFIRPRYTLVCIYKCVSLVYYIIYGGQGTGNETHRVFLSGLNIQLSKQYSKETQHTACTNTQFHTVCLTGDPGYCSLRYHSASCSSNYY